MSDMRSKILALGAAAAIAMAAGFSALWLAGTANAQSMNTTRNDGNSTNSMSSMNMTSSGNSTTSSMQSTVVRDSILLVGPKTIPAHDFIHIYDTTPYMIMNGHVAAKLPCDADAKTPLQIWVGQAPNLKPATLDLIKELSTPGKQCLYHTDLVSDNKAGTIITDVAISNPTDKNVRLGLTGSVFVGVDEIMPGAAG